MKAILIDVDKKEVREVEVSEDQDILEQWYKLLGVEMVEIACQIGDGDSILVDEEGLLKLTKNTNFFRYKGIYQPFAGNGLVVGMNRKGDNISHHTSVEEISSKIQFISGEDVIKLV